jgi:hypothetical protein
MLPPILVWLVETTFTLALLVTMTGLLTKVASIATFTPPDCCPAFVPKFPHLYNPVKYYAVTLRF